MLSRLNICSKESVVRQYDHEVQGGSVVKPLTGVVNDGPSDAAVIRPLLDSFEGIVIANGICPRYSDIDAYHMAAAAIDEAVRNAIAVGTPLDRLAGLDNFCWCDPVRSEKTPDGEYKLAQLVRANQALYDITTAYGVPCISGKDSMKNDYQIGSVRISIPPTLLFSTLGKMEDVRKAVTMDVKKPGDLVYVLGKTFPELGGIGVVRPSRRHRKQCSESGCKNGKGPLRGPPQGDHGGARRLLPRLLRRRARRGAGGDGLRRRPGAGDRSCGRYRRRESPGTTSSSFRNHRAVSS